MCNSDNERGKYKSSDGSKPQDQQQIQEVHVAEGYKYIGVLEADEIKDNLMKEAITRVLQKNKESTEVKTK